MLFPSRNCQRRAQEAAWNERLKVSIIVHHVATALGVRH